MAATGQTINDRLNAVRYALVGQGLARTVCKATTEEVIGPKKKHMDYLLACTNEPNVSIPQMANLLIERTQHTSWAVVFKALISIHHLMSYGNERFTQYLATSNHSFELADFMDRTTPQGYNMSTFVRRYAKYINDKAISYRTLAIDLCKIRSGNDNALRTMNMDNLSKTLPIVQAQFDSMLEFGAETKDLNNGIIMSAFRLLYKDLVKLYVAYQEAIINLLERYFKLSRKKTREALEMYKKYLARMDKVAGFFKIVDSVGLDKSEMPDLTKSPASILKVLEEHLAKLEAKKRGTTATSPEPAAREAQAGEGDNDEGGNKENDDHGEQVKKQADSNEHRQQTSSAKLSSATPSPPPPVTETPSPTASNEQSAEKHHQPPQKPARPPASPKASPKVSPSAPKPTQAPEKKVAPPERPTKPPSRPPPPAAPASASTTPAPSTGRSEAGAQRSGESSLGPTAGKSTNTADCASSPIPPPHPPPPSSSAVAAAHHPPAHTPAPSSAIHHQAPASSSSSSPTARASSAQQPNDLVTSTVTNSIIAASSVSTASNPTPNANAADTNGQSHQEEPTASTCGANNPGTESTSDEHKDNHTATLSSTETHELETNHVSNNSTAAAQEAQVIAVEQQEAAHAGEEEMPAPPPPIEDDDDLDVVQAAAAAIPPINAELDAAQEPVINGQNTNGAE